MTMARYRTIRDALNLRLWPKFLGRLVGRGCPVSVADLDRAVRKRHPGTKSEDRAAIYAYLDGKRPVQDPEIAFEFGEALRACGEAWCSGPVALCGAGFYTEFIKILRALATTKQHAWLAVDLLMHAPWAALHPLVQPQAAVGPEVDAPWSTVEKWNKRIADARKRLTLLLADAPIPNGKARSFYPRKRHVAVESAPKPWKSERPVFDSEQLRAAAALGDRAVAFCDAWRDTKSFDPVECFLAAAIPLRAWALQIVGFQAWSDVSKSLDEYAKVMRHLQACDSESGVVIDAETALAGSPLRIDLADTSDAKLEL